MPKASITLPDGTNVVVTGKPDEISRVLALYGANAGTPCRKVKRGARSTKARRAKSKARTSGSKRPKAGPKTYILELKQDNYFKVRRTISDIQKKLEQEGHILPTNELSTPLRRLVTNKELKRLKEKKGWVYVNR